MAERWGLPERRRIIGASLALLVAGLLALGFVTSYAAALHTTTPHDVPIAVSAQVPAAVSSRLDSSAELEVEPAADSGAAEQLIDRREAYASLTATRGGLVLTTAPAASPTIAALLERTLPGTLEAAGAGRTQLATVHTLPNDDIRGLVGFYLVVGWIVAGYIGATLLGVAFGTGTTRAIAAWRMWALACLGVVAGLATSVVAVAIGGLDGSLAMLTLLGLLTVLAAGAVTNALQALLGTAGTLAAVVVFVIVGNPASGGPSAPELMPSLWRWVGQYMPAGAGTTGVRNVNYFPDASIAAPVVVLVAWILIGIAASVAIGSRTRATDEVDAEVAAVGVIT